jgi:predicted amidohydrolase
LTARAIENTVYAVGAGQGPPEYSGHSAVVDPYGVVLTELGGRDGVHVADLNNARLREVRERMPSLLHRRFRTVPAEDEPDGENRHNGLWPFST